MHKLEIITPRLKLVLPNASAASFACAYFIKNKIHLQPTDPVMPKDFWTETFWQKRLEKSIHEFEQDQSVRLFVEFLDSPNQYIGVITFTQIARGPFQACYLGYSIDADFEGKGLMYEALEHAIQYMFRERSIHRIMANHLVENQKSANVLRRLGFHVDGSSPDYLFIQGTWRTHVLNSLTNQSWQPRSEDRDLFLQN